MVGVVGADVFEGVEGFAPGESDVGDERVGAGTGDAVAFVGNNAEDVAGGLFAFEVCADAGKSSWVIFSHEGWMERYRGGLPEVPRPAARTLICGS